MTFFSIVKPVFRENRDFYLFYYSAILKDHLFFSRLSRALKLKSLSSNRKYIFKNLVEKYVRLIEKNKRKLMLLLLSLSNMPEYAWICAYISRILNMPRVLNMAKYWIWQSSEYVKLLNMTGFSIYECYTAF